jgi:hypothetical protein
VARLHAAGLVVVKGLMDEHGLRQRRRWVGKSVT